MTFLNKILDILLPDIDLETIKWTGNPPPKPGNPAISGKSGGANRDLCIRDPASPVRVSRVGNHVA
jgi:hypothetical protein